MGLKLEEKIANTFRAYDIRGVYGVDLDEELAVHLGYGIARALPAEKATDPSRMQVAVCRDCRTSGPALADALIEGLTDGGISVLDIGEGPTPLLYYACKTAGVAGGVMITASHNPPDQNGFKVWLGEGNVFGDGLAQIGRLGLEGVPEAARTGSVRKADLSGRYMDAVFESVGAPSPSRPYRVGVDCGNGVAGPLIVPLLERMGCEVTQVYCEPDGTFPNHHPDPTVPANLADLAGEVRRCGCEVGLAFDADVDRLGALESDGRMVIPDQLLYLFGREVARERPGAKIIGDVKCSDAVFEMLARDGAEPIMSRTGHSFIKRRIKDEGAALAGEMSGHFFFADRYLGYDDAIYAACRLVALLIEKDCSLDEALAGFPKTASTPELRLPCPEERKAPVLEALEKAIDSDADAGRHGLRGVSKIDGLRPSFEDGWCLVRSSHTGPILVLRFEGMDEGALERIERFFCAKVAEAAPELSQSLSQLLEVCV
ncbi:MAG: phosphomannomutase/phosphoglucomutase [Actinobacteria bacterium]|nr:MAG: phosphomannomutase/phosphoglucomutase [Actinomycetota bacterium]